MTEERPASSGRLSFFKGARKSRYLAPIVQGCEIEPINLAPNITWSLTSDFEATPFVGVHARLDDLVGEVEHLDDLESTSDIVRRAVEGAVERAVAGARRVAVMTGGGLDSSALMALVLARMQKEGGEAFAVALDYAADGDDRPHLAALQAHLGCEVLRVAPEEARHELVGLVNGVDASPVYCPTASLEVTLMKRARDNGAERVLMGVGGDQLFDGRPSSLANLARRGSFRAAIRSARTLRGFSRPRFPVLSWIVRPMLAEALPSFVRARRLREAPSELPCWAGPVAREFERRERWRQVDELKKGSDSLLSHILTAQCVQAAWVRHQESVAAGVERRDPFLDPQLIAELHELPPHDFLHDATRRGLFRHAVRDLLPKSLLQREDKASFEPALHRMLAAAQVASRLRDVAKMKHLSKLGLVNATLFQAACSAFLTNPRDPSAWTDVWCTLAVEAFLERRAQS